MSVEAVSGLIVPALPPFNVVKVANSIIFVVIIARLPHSLRASKTVSNQATIPLILYTSESTAQTQDLPVAATLLDVTLCTRKRRDCLRPRLVLSIPAGKRTCIVGANGSGKSTVAPNSLSLSAPDEGTVTFLGTTVVNDGQVDFGGVYGPFARSLAWSSKLRTRLFAALSQTILPLV